MSVLDVVGSYYDAWISGMGDFDAVPLAPDFAFTGPVASFDSAEGFRQMAAQAGPMVTRFSVRRQGLRHHGPDRPRGMIVEITGFADPALFPLFGLP